LATVAWTQADIDSLKAAIASGVRSVTYSGPPSRTIEYQSLDEMRAALASMVQSVNAQAGKVGHRVVSTKKGFDS